MKIKKIYELKKKTVGKKLGLLMAANERQNPIKIIVNFSLYVFFELSFKSTIKIKQNMIRVIDSDSAWFLTACPM